MERNYTKPKSLSFKNYAFLSPGQTDSQEDASWKRGSTCDSVWPGFACSCAELRWLAHILVEIKFARKSRQVFHRLATQPKSTQVEWRLLTDYKPTKYKICLPWNGFLWLGCTCEKSCQCVWPPNASLYVSSTCDHLRLLAGPFDQGLTWWLSQTEFHNDRVQHDGDLQ